MNSKSYIVPVCAAFLTAVLCDAPRAYASTPTDACSLVTAAQVSAAMGFAVGSGKALNPHDCQFVEPGAGGKTVLVEILGPTGRLTPVDRFNTVKMPVGRVVKTPVSGLGDDAVYVETLGVALYVRKGDFVFQIRISGLPLAECKEAERLLAQNVLANL